MILLIDEQETAVKQQEYESCLKVVQNKGVMLCGVFYFHTEMANYVGKKVEVRYVPNNYAKVWAVLPNQQVVEAASSLIARKESQELRAAVSQQKYADYELLLACEAALLLRGIHAAILDPLALVGEKETYRKRYKEIETQIRAAIENAKRRS